MAEREHQAQMMDKTVQTALDTIVRMLARSAAHEIIAQSRSCSPDAAAQSAEQEINHD
jgi:hypothetical protein